LRTLFFFVSNDERRGTGTDRVSAASVGDRKCPSRSVARTYRWYMQWRRCLEAAGWPTPCSGPSRLDFFCPRRFLKKIVQNTAPVSGPVTRAPCGPNFWRQYTLHVVKSNAGCGARCALRGDGGTKCEIDHFFNFHDPEKKSNENWIAGRPSGADVARRPRRTRFDAI